MLDNLSPLSNRTSALLESWIWSDCSHGYFVRFPHTWLMSLHTCWKSPSLNWTYNNRLFVFVIAVKWKAIKLVPATFTRNITTTCTVLSGDPWFPRGRGGGPLNCYFAQFYSENFMKIEEFGPRTLPWRLFWIRHWYLYSLSFWCPKLEIYLPLAGLAETLCDGKLNWSLHVVSARVTTTYKAIQLDKAMN